MPEDRESPTPESDPRLADQMQALVQLLDQKGIVTKVELVGQKSSNDWIKTLLSTFLGAALAFWAGQCSQQHQEQVEKDRLILSKLEEGWNRMNEYIRWEEQVSQCVSAGTLPYPTRPWMLTNEILRYVNTYAPTSGPLAYRFAQYASIFNYEVDNCTISNSKIVYDSAFRSQRKRLQSLYSELQDSLQSHIRLAIGYTSNSSETALPLTLDSVPLLRTTIRIPSKTQHVWIV
jgi:hypothetical protein